MATKKVTITLDENQLAAVRNLVTSGKAKNISSFVQHAVAVSLADVAGWVHCLGSRCKKPAARSLVKSALGRTHCCKA